LLWPMLWLPVVTMTCVAVVTVIVLPVMWSQGSAGMLESLGAAIAWMFGSLILAGILWLFELPTMLLRAFNPCYRERFRRVFCSAGHDIPPVVAVARVMSDDAGANPFRA